MPTFFLTLLVLGVVVLALQFLMGLLGVDGEGMFDDTDAADGLDLFTVRALAAAAATFGLFGIIGIRFGLPGWLAAPIALGFGIGAAYAVAAAMRGMRRFEVDKSFEITMALGQPAKVYLSIPGRRSGEGKVHLTSHDRFIELNAVTADSDIAAGEMVTVVDSVNSDTVVVSRSSNILGETQ